MESTLRRTWAEIDLDALAHNYHKLRERIGADVKFLGVVKADAYGHGSVQVSHLLQEGEAVTLESVANQLEVSVMPVREAFQILARDGLIKLQRNKGAVVLGINETYIREHYQLRAILESAAAEMCCAPEVDITRIEESYECAAESIQNNDFAAYADQNREFHSEIWSAAGNSRMENMIAELWNGLSMGSMITEAEYAKVSIEEHERIMKAIRERNGAAAKEEMYRHIMRSRDDMLTNYR